MKTPLNQQSTSFDFGASETRKEKRLKDLEAHCAALDAMVQRLIADKRKSDAAFEAYKKKAIGQMESFRSAINGIANRR